MRSCGGFDDWKVVAEKAVLSKKAGKNLQDRFKGAFHPVHLDRVGNGETDIVLLPEKVLVGEGLAKLEPNVRALYLAARSRMYDAVKAAPYPEEPYETDEDREANRYRGELQRDEEDTRVENLNRAADSRESGFYYED